MLVEGLKPIRLLGVVWREAMREYPGDTAFLFTFAFRTFLIFSGGFLVSFRGFQ